MQEQRKYPLTRFKTCYEACCLHYVLLEVHLLSCADAAFGQGEVSDENRKSLATICKSRKCSIVFGF